MTVQLWRELHLEEARGQVQEVRQSHASARLPLPRPQWEDRDGVSPVPVPGMSGLKGKVRSRCMLATTLLILSSRSDRPQCLRSLSAMAPQEIMDKYGFPDLRSAETLNTRAKGVSSVMSQADLTG